MKKLRLLFLGIVSLPVISVFACAESTSNNSSSGGTSSGTSPTSTSTKPAPCTGTDCANPDDSGSSKNDGSEDSGNNNNPPGPDANNPANTLSLKDSGNTRFADQYFSNYTCPAEPGLGKVIAWTLPAPLATALGIPGTGPFRLRVSSGNNNNAQILGPAPQNTVYFEGDVLIALLNNGEVPVVTLASKPPASGGVILSGKYTCP